MNIVQIDESGQLFLSPDVDDWQPVEDQGITAVIDLDGDLDIGVPTVPNHMLYVYFPIRDDDLPDLDKLHALASLGASLTKTGYRVLSHCGMGLNRSALMTGLILVYLGMKGAEAVELIRSKRPGALYNENFAAYLASQDPASLECLKQVGVSPDGQNLKVL